MQDFSVVRFLSGLLTWMYQIIQSENDFLREFVSVIGLKPGKEANMMEEIVLHGILEDFHESILPYLPFRSPDFVQLHNLESELDNSMFLRLAQAALEDPIGCFNKIYLLDFYITKIPPMLIQESVLTAYLIHLREGFYSGFRSAVEIQTLSLQESANREDLGSLIRTPGFVVETVEFVGQLISVFESQIVALRKELPVDLSCDERILEFNDILDRTYTPVINLSR